MDFVQRERSHRAGKVASDAARAKDADGPDSGEKPCPGRSAAERIALSRVLGNGSRPGVRRPSGGPVSGKLRIVLARTGREVGLAELGMRRSYGAVRNPERIDPFQVAGRDRA